MENSDDDVAPVVSDLYFLMHKFLSGGPLRKTLQTLQDELAEYQMLPKRTDWLGSEHERTIEDMQQQYPYVRPDYLLQVCCRASVSTNNSSKPPEKAVSLFSLNKRNDVEYNFKQLCDYIKRKHGVPTRNLKITCNIVNILRGREVSGPVSRRWVTSPKLYSSLHFQRRTLGHLSAVYCLLFDHTGRYIITGADDLLIKVWSSITGRLIATLRGACSEITDIAINLRNSLIAAGSIDRNLRIWDLQTGAPVAVLTGHTGMITSVNFCPSPSWGLQYLITTSTDGSVAFWAYTYDTGGKVNFRAKPTMYQEKMRPGQAQMICSSFSPGGTFLATGSADHHVRVYYMKGDEGPHRILETEAHNDRVDSIQWAHSGLRFLSGSKDGTAIVWSFESQQWKSLYLYMTQANTGRLTPTKAKAADDPRKLKVTMVSWDSLDVFAITAVSDYTLKIWDTRTGELCKVLTGHTDEVYVLEAHPHDRNVILSAGHDGQLFIWDIMKGEMISKFVNNIENQGCGAIFDVKWSPDGNVVAASDSHGHILIFGFGNGHKLFEQLPKELFFHTDYRPLVRDASNCVMDEQTQIPPHLMPPPFLVDIDGNPYPPMLQRLVPGREHCKTEQLVPSIVIGNEGNQEIIQVISEENGRNDQDDIRYNVVVSRPGGSGIRNEGIRQSTGDWQSDPNMKWQRHVLVQQLKPAQVSRVLELVDTMETLEMQEYRRQLCSRPHMINTSNNLNLQASKSTDNKKRSGNYLTRNSKYRSVKPVVVLSSEPSSAESDCSDSTGHSDWVAEENVNVEAPKRSKRRKVKKYSEDDDDDDDEEEDVEIEDITDEDDDGDDEGGRKSNRIRNRRRRPKTNTGHDGDDDSSGDEPEKPRPIPKPTRVPVRITSANKEAILETYKTSEWLTEVRPRKSPYFPQMGDEVVYFPQGHHLYLDAVRAKKVYEINNKNLPWTKMHFRGHEFAKVLDIQYEIKPPTLCNLKMVLLDEEGRLSGKIFVVKYHDMPDVLDFLVLKQNFDAAMSREWKVGDKFRCMIDDGWWVGEIVAKNSSSNSEDPFPNSPFLCYDIKWDNGELDTVSPWDMEPLDLNRLPENTSEALPVLEEELQSILYQPTVDDWPNSGRESVTEYVLSGLSKVMELAIAEPFLVPVDLTRYPEYVTIVEYPIDLSAIKARFENRFYRRITAAQFDIRRLAFNAEKFNERHSHIVKHARILTELCLRIIIHCTMNVDVNALYHQLVDTYDSSDTEVDVEILPSSSRMLRSLSNRQLRNASDWKGEAQYLFKAIWDCEDSEPFRAPVNTAKYKDYLSIVENPMDLSIVKDKLLHDKYETPKEFYKDMKLIFQNSRKYNTKQRSRIYVMTVRLAAIVEEHMNKIIENWDIAKSRELSSQGSSKSETQSDMSLTDIENKVYSGTLPERVESDSDDEDNIPLKKLSTQQATIKSDSEHNASSSSSSNSNSGQLNGNSNSEDEEEENDSDGSYKPQRSTRSKSKRKHLTDSSSEEVEEDDQSDVDAGEGYSSDSSDDKPIAQYNGRASRSRSSKNGLINKRKRISSDHENSDGETYYTSVSSRGRIRKLNMRVTALMKK